MRLAFFSQTIMKLAELFEGHRNGDPGNNTLITVSQDQHGTGTRRFGHGSVCISLDFNMALYT